MQVFVLWYIVYMRLHRFYIDNIVLDSGNCFVTQETDLIHQLKNVFRYKIGQKVLFFNEKVGEIEFEIKNIDKKDMSFIHIRQMKGSYDDSKNKRQNVLCMSIIKNNNFELVVEKAVELGINKIIPIISNRVIKSNLNMDRLTKIIKESTEQSGRLDIMNISEPKTMEDVLSDCDFDDHLKYFGSIDKTKTTEFLLKSSRDKKMVFVGPEGGFSENEILFFNKNKITPICVNENVLRAETAAIVLASMMNL